MNGNFVTKRSSTRIRFLVAGGFNFLVTNFCLQLLLLNPATPTIISASASQALNAVLGFFLYRGTVFTQRGKEHKRIEAQARQAFRYCLLSLGLLATNTTGINLVTAAGLSRNLGAGLMIPLLTIASYWGQKHWVFRKVRSEQIVAATVPGREIS